MLRVIGVALMNVIPVVTTVFGTAYAVQPAYRLPIRSERSPTKGITITATMLPATGIQRKTLLSMLWSGRRDFGLQLHGQRVVANS
jgi:hypothetical protein